MCIRPIQFFLHVTRNGKTLKKQQQKNTHTKTHPKYCEEHNRLNILWHFKLIEKLNCMIFSFSQRLKLHVQSRVRCSVMIDSKPCTTSSSRLGLTCPLRNVSLHPFIYISLESGVIGYLRSSASVAGVYWTLVEPTLYNVPLWCEHQCSVD